jgi:large subunit ribosomal protein L3
MRHLVEFRDEDLGAEEGPKIGDDVTVAAFEAGQKVKVAGISIGKGFQGGIKRHNFSRGPVTHGSHNVRAPGSVGASAFPARVFKGMRMPGQMGNKRITQKGLEIADVDAERNLLLIKGSVPGARNGLVEVRTDG